MKSAIGFTLVEIAIVLAILAFIMSALIFPLTKQNDYKRMATTQERLEEIKEALLGFAILNDSLPCPALLAEDGKSPLPPCDKEGYLPWAELGVGRYDSWGNPFRYRVDKKFTESSFPEPPAYTNSRLVAQDTQTIPTNLVKFEVDDDGNDYSRIIAIIFSYGKDGEPNDENGGTINEIYAQDVYVENTFDDILIWLPKSILINRLAAAGKWPPP